MLCGYVCDVLAMTRNNLPTASARQRKMKTKHTAKSRQHGLLKKRKATENENERHTAFPVHKETRDKDSSTLTPEAENENEETQAQANAGESDDKATKNEEVARYMKLKKGLVAVVVKELAAVLALKKVIEVW